MIEVNVTFKGLSDLDEALKHLPVEMQRTVLRRGLRFAGDALKASMARLAPRALVHRVRRRGKNYPVPLAASMATRIRFRRDGDPTAAVGPRAFWGRFVELGTTVQSPRSFMRRALQEDGQIIVAAFANGMRQQLEVLLRRAKRLGG